MPQVASGSSIVLNSVLDIKESEKAKEAQKNSDVRKTQSISAEEDARIVLDFEDDDTDKKQETDYNKKDGTIGTSKQKLNDCWVLSGINGLSYTKEGANIIKNILEYQDGKTRVYLKGVDKYYTISDKEVDVARNKYKCSQGDDDVAILELAITKARQDIQNCKIILDKEAPTPSFGKNDINYGDNKETLFYLTGKVAEWLPTYEDMDKANKMLQMFQDRDDYVLTASKSKAETVQNIKGEEITLPGSHAYSVKEATNDTVTVINPWDSNKEIVLGKDVFLNTFETIEGLDLSENNPAKNYLIETDRATKEYKDGSKLETVKDKAGNTIAKVKFDKDGNKLFAKKYTTLSSGRTEVRKQTYNKKGDTVKTSEKTLNNANVLVFSHNTEFDNKGKINREVSLNYNDEGKKTRRSERRYEHGREVYIKISGYNEDGLLKSTETTTKKFGFIDTKTTKNYNKNKKLKSADYEEYGKNNQLLRSKHDKNGDGKIDSAKYYMYDSKGNLDKIKVDKDNDGMWDKIIKPKK